MRVIHNHKNYKCIKEQQQQKLLCIKFGLRTGVSQTILHSKNYSSLYVYFEFFFLLICSLDTHIQVIQKRTVNFYE